MTSILDTIDNAVSDWETSADAMRWTPEPPKVATGGQVTIRLDNSAGRFSPPHALPPEEIAASTRLADHFAQVRVALLDGIAEAIKGLAAAFRPLLDEARWRQPRRPERLSRLRRDYRAKRGGRW